MRGPVGGVRSSFRARWVPRRALPAGAKRRTAGRAGHAAAAQLTWRPAEARETIWESGGEPAPPKAIQQPSPIIPRPYQSPSDECAADSHHPGRG
jgi:hypothetical protein